MIKTTKFENKTLFDQTYPTTEAKVRRIKFVMDVVFRNQQFENINPSNQASTNLSSIPEVSELKK